MTLEAILERLAALGVTVERRTDSEHPILLNPASRIPAELRPEVVAHKRDLAALLQRRERAWSADPPEVCQWNCSPGEDPRPDLPDSDVWGRLLQLASGDTYDQSGVYGRLLGARACGAVLEWGGRRWKLGPTIDPSERISVWAAREAWEADVERWLRPRSREIVALLGQIPPPVEELA